jgi:DNA (cytosine-5)-methyltransferase 1
MIYKTIDLCAGIGGIRRGFELTGMFETVLSAEIDDSACQTYEHLYGDNPKNDLTSEEFKQRAVETEYDVLLAGFPCQTFSRAGQKMGFRDTTKGTIFFDIADIISRTNPRAVFLENVENLVSHDKGETLRRIVTTLEDELQYRIIGVTMDEDGSYMYSGKSFIRNSRNFGLPQNRPRVYIMAFSKKMYGDAVKVLTEDLPFSGRKVIAEDLNAILEPVVDDGYYMASGYLETLKKHKVREKSKGHGFGYVVVNAPGIEHPIASTILATGGSGKERNLIYQPKEGVAGKTYPTKKTPLNSEGIRVMTPTEWGRLQGFVGYAFLDKDGNDTFSFPAETSRAQQYK